MPSLLYFSDLIEFSQMLINTTGCGVLSNLKLGNYGSYCGLGGKGVPVDMIDQCCCYHDKCYENLSVWWIGKYGDNCL